MGIISDILFSNKNGLFTKRALDVYAQKQLLINSNIANAETPGYKAAHIKPFERALFSAYKSSSGIQMTTTNQRHLSGPTGNLKKFEPEVVTSQAPGRMDGNNVNLDKEIITMNENQMMYRAVITARTKRGKMISGAMDQTR